MRAWPTVLAVDATSRAALYAFLGTSVTAVSSVGIAALAYRAQARKPTDEELTDRARDEMLWLEVDRLRRLVDDDARPRTRKTDLLRPAAADTEPRRKRQP